MPSVAVGLERVRVQDVAYGAILLGRATAGGHPCSVPGRAWPAPRGEGVGSRGAERTWAMNYSRPYPPSPWLAPYLQRQLRRLGGSERALAEAMGVSRPGVNKVLRGQVFSPTPDFLRRFARASGASLPWLLGLAGWLYLTPLDRGLAAERLRPHSPQAHLGTRRFAAPAVPLHSASPALEDQGRAVHAWLRACEVALPAEWEGEGPPGQDAARAKASAWLRSARTEPWLQSEADQYVLLGLLERYAPGPALWLLGLLPVEVIREGGLQPLERQGRDLLAEPGALEELTRRARAVPTLMDVPGDPPDPAGTSEWRVRRLGRGAAAVTLRLPADRAERIDGWLREVEAAARRAMEP